MVYDRGPFRHYGGHSADASGNAIGQDEELSQRARSGHVGGSLGREPPDRARRRRFLVHDQSEPVGDLHDVLTAQSAFVQEKMDMFAGGAKALSDVVEMPGTVVGGYTARAQWRKRAEDIGRNSPNYAAKSNMRKG